MNSMSIIIPIHSVVDLITNSSSEIFVCANKSTIKAIKNLIDDIFKLTDSENSRRAEDFFTIELSREVENTDTLDTKFVSEKEYKEIERIWAKYEDDQNGEEDEPTWQPSDDGEFTNAVVVVTPIDSTCAISKRVAKTLSDLTGLFEIDAQYN